MSLFGKQFKGRYNRVYYINVCMTATAILLLLLLGLLSIISQSLFASKNGALVFLLLIPYLYIIFRATVLRLQDMGSNNYSYALLVFAMPVIGIFVCGVIPGSIGDNRFGRPQPFSQRQEYYLMGLILVCVPTGILYLLINNPLF